MSNLSRRAFLGDLGSFAALFASGRAFAAPHGLFAAGKPLLTFGAVSDIHFHNVPTRETTKPAYFLKALKSFRDRGADAVVVAGDLANSGLTEEFEEVAQRWFEVFPGDRRPDGSPMGRIIVTGNHDAVGSTYRWGQVAREKMYPQPAEFAAHVLANDYAGAWKRCYHEDYADIYLRKVNGYVFIGQHWTADDPPGRKFGRRLKAFLKAHADEIPKDRPFFYVQHPIPHGTNFGAFARGSTDQGGTLEALADWPNAVALSGHSHWSITDDRCVWQGAFTSINLGCLWRTGFARTTNVDSERGYENWRTYGKEKELVDARKAMPHIPTAFDNRTGCFVSVYADRLVVERYNFGHDLPMDEDWVIPLGGKERPFAYETAAKRPGPAFPAGAKIELSEKSVKVRGGSNEPCLVVTIPAATANATRAREYRIDLSASDGACSRAVLANGVDLPRSLADKQGATDCSLVLADLPKARPLKVTVTPSDCYGTCGVPLSAVFG